MIETLQTEKLKGNIESRETLSVEKFKQLKNISWKISNTPPKKEDAWKSFKRDTSFTGDDEPSWFIYDPNKIKVDYLLLDNIDKSSSFAKFRKSKIEEAKKI